MGGTLKNRLKAYQARLDEQIGSDISTPKARAAALLHYRWMDHGILRVLWRNLHMVAPGVYRSNQPSDRQLRETAQRLGLKTVMNLRGNTGKSYYLFEKETCDALGLTLIDLPMSARAAPSRAVLEQIYALFQTLQKPVLIHCKSGADRTGLVAALYLLMMENQPISVAKRQVSFRYLHVANSPAGIQDHILRFYEAAHRKTGIGFVDWMRQDYDPAAITASFAKWRAGDRTLP